MLLTAAWLHCSQTHTPARTRRHRAWRQRARSNTPAASAAKMRALSGIVKMEWIKPAMQIKSTITSAHRQSPMRCARRSFLNSMVDLLVQIIDCESIVILTLRMPRRRILSVRGFLFSTVGTPLAVFLLVNNNSSAELEKRQNFHLGGRSRPRRVPLFGRICSLEVQPD